MRRESGRLTVGDLASKMARLKVVGENLSEEERGSYIQDLYQNTGEEVDFELFLKVSFIIWSFQAITFLEFWILLLVRYHLFIFLVISFLDLF